MKKLFTLAAALLASFSLWAANPDFESYDWDQTEVASVVGTHGDITILSEGLGSVGNVSSHYYIPNNQNLKNSDSSWKFFGISAKSKIDSIAILWCPNGGNATSIAWVAWGENVTPNQYTLGHGVLPSITSSKSWDAAIWQTIDLTAIDAYTVYTSRNIREFREIGGTSNLDNFGGGQTINILGIRVWLAPTCEQPAAPLSITSDASDPLYEGNTIHLTLNGGNGATKVLKLDGTEFEYLTWMAVAGEHTFTVSQEANEGYCEQTASLTLNVLAATPVTACTVDGPTTGVIGKAITLTATAANATEFRWLDKEGSVIAGANTNTYTFTPNAKGEYRFSCHARNTFNGDNWVPSEIKIINITKLCGELIKATTNGVVTGVVGGTYDTNNGTGDTKKLDKNKYYGLKLAEGTFQAGDVFSINVTTAANTENSKCMLYADKEGAELIVDAGSEGYLNTTGVLTVTLPAAVNGKNSIYLYRENGNTQWNPTFNWISVTRACEDSNDANIYWLKVNGEEVAEDDGVFRYTVGATDDATEAWISYAIHPLATSSKINPFYINVPAAGETNGDNIKITAEDGTEKTYTVFISKAAAANDDATLKALSVEGFTLDVEFDPAVTAYTIHKAYGASDPAVSAVTATPNDPNAKNVEITLTNGVFTIVVTAEDNNTTKEYTITILENPAKKDLLRVSFSNSVIGFIDNHNIRVPYMAGEAAPTFVSATFWNPDGEPTAEMDGNRLKVTGIDSEVDYYDIQLIEVPVMTANYDEITFENEPDYIYSVYGFASDKGVKISKDVEEASNRRISKGNDRLYIALPAAKAVKLTSGSGGARPVKILVNGEASSVNQTAASGEAITIELDGTKNNFVSIESNGSNGDGGFTKLQLVEADATGISNTEAEVKAVKVIRNGQLFIEKNGVLYNAQGAVVK